MFDYVIICCT